MLNIYIFFLHPEYIHTWQMFIHCDTDETHFREGIMMIQELTLEVGNQGAVVIVRLLLRSCCC